MSRLPALLRQHIAALRVLLIFTVITGIGYPLVVLGITQVAFHHQANGSPVSYQGHVVGSSLLCQEFTNAKGNPLAAVLPAPAVQCGQRGGQDRLRLRPRLLRPRPTWARTTPRWCS